MKAESLEADNSFKGYCFGKVIPAKDSLNGVGIAGPAALNTFPKNCT